MRDIRDFDAAHVCRCETASTLVNGHTTALLASSRDPEHPDLVQPYLWRIDGGAALPTTTALVRKGLIYHTAVCSTCQPRLLLMQVQQSRLTPSMLPR